MRDAQLVMPKAVSAAMAAWITARRICVQVIFLDSWLDSFMEISVFCQFKVSIRPTTGIKPLYTTIATVTMNLIVSAAIVLLNPYVTIYISYKIPPFALSVHIPDVSTSIYVEVDSKVLLGLPFCDKAFVR